LRLQGFGEGSKSNINLSNYSPFSENCKVFFSAKHLKKVRKIRDRAILVSTVCPDYPNNGAEYTFVGELGTGISLTAQDHIKGVPSFIQALKQKGVSTEYLILVADLPEVAQCQESFYKSVAGSREEYLRRCSMSAKSIQDKVGDLARVGTFSGF